MKRVVHWLFNLLRLVLVLTCAACILLWIRSYSSYDRMVVRLSGSYTDGRRLKWGEAESCNGDLRLSLYWAVVPVVGVESPPERLGLRPYRPHLWPRGIKLIPTREMTAVELREFEDRMQQVLNRFPLVYLSSRKRITLPPTYVLANGKRPPFQWQFGATHSMHDLREPFMLEYLAEDHDLPGAYAVRRLVIPHGYAVSACAAVPLLSVIVWTRKRMISWSRSRRGLCTACGYDIRESGGTCSECGNARRNSTVT